MAGFDGQDDDLRAIIGVKLREADAEFVHAVGGGLDDEQHLGVVVNLPLPAIKGAQSGDDIDAGSHARFYQAAGQRRGGVCRSGGEENSRLGHFGFVRFM